MAREAIDSSTVLGPFFVGHIFSLILLGISAMQLLYYYAHHSRDKSWLKFFVTGLFALNTIASTINMVYIHRTMIVFFGNQVELTKIDWYIAIEPLLAAIIILFCQCFFARRAYDLTGNWLYSVAIVATGAASAVGGILDTQRLFQMSDWSHLLDTKDSMIIWLIPGLISDCVIAGVHLWYFFQNKSRFSRNEMTVDRILRVCAETGLVIPIAALVAMIVYFASQNTGLYLVFSVPLPKILSTTLQCGLNARQGWNFRGYYSESGAEILQPKPTAYVMNAAADVKQPQQPSVVVTVHKEQW